MTGNNFVERVHAYSKWLLGLDSAFEKPCDEPRNERAKPA